jgi:hypothetical protein
MPKVLDFSSVLLKIVAMEEKSLKIYKSLFYLNLDSLKNLIQEESDLYLIFPVPKEIAYPESSVQLTAFDVLRMKIDIWARVKTQDNLKLLTGFLPDNIYKRALECKEYLDAKFPEFNTGFEYVKHRGLMLDIYANKNYIDEEAFNDYVNQGFESLDLELVNAAVARNEALVIDLLKNGADPAINIFNSEAMIDLMDYLEHKESYCFVEYNSLLMDDFNQYKYVNLFESLSDLYAVASTSKMLLLIDFYKVI